MIARILELSARYRVFVLVTFAALTFLAVRAIRQVPLDAIPDLSDPQVIVFSEWRGRSPTLVEDQVTYPIASALLAAPGVRAVRGFSMFGMSFVYVLFDEGTDLYWARSRVNEYMAGIGDALPRDVRPRLGPDASGIGWVYEYALVDPSGRHDLAKLRALQDFHLRYALASVPGVAEVATVGGYERQYQAMLDPEKLRAYGVSVQEVADAVRRASGEVGGRLLEMSGREYFVRGRGYVTNLDDLAQAILRVDADGTPITVGDVATLRFGADLRRGVAELDGQGEVVGAIVVARQGENALAVIERVEKRLDELRQTLPEGVQVVTTYDRSDLIRRAIATLRDAVTEELITVAVVIVLFLLHFRSALLPIISLPLAVALAFIPMQWLGVPATIMSLGGIAIAIGATVDAEIVMIEACHKKLEHAPADLDEKARSALLRDAAREVTPAIFFSLLIIAVSFLPVFGLTGQAGRLFRPLAYTKTFVMLSAALLSITLAPALRDLLVRGRIVPEDRHPVSRVLRAAYEPFVHVALRRPITTLLIGVFAVLSTIPIYPRIGSEFMPELDEGDLLYMPTTLPNLSIDEAKEQLVRQDAVLRSMPEVARVFGKAGRADTPTDPAPLSMVETVIQLRPREEWPLVHQARWYSGWAPEPRRRIRRRNAPEERRETKDELVAKLNAELQLPGWTNAFTMPIRARVDMLTTGVRTPVGIKVFGPDLESIEETGVRLESLLQRVPGTRSVFYERALGGSYVDIEPNRAALARYGLSVEELGAIVESAIGGEPVAVTVDGRKRFTMAVRYKDDFRRDPERLREVLLPGVAVVPLGEVADVVVREGPPMVRNEAGQLVGYVYVDLLPSRDLGGYVEDAKAAVAAATSSGALVLPRGVHLAWTGQFEELAAMKERMKLLVPLALLACFVLLYLQFRNVIEVLIVFLSIPFALVGSFWCIYLLDYRFSTAVWVGIIALVGLATQTGVVMIVYIDQAFLRRAREGRIRTLEDIVEAHAEGTVQRVRPKLMTVGTMLVSLVPLLWAEGSGADVMKRIAAPMVGGLVSSAFLTLELIPVVYTYWRYWELRRAQKKNRLLTEVW
jgi:Cu(I)/Ag(I) efflux system membrane protein CusA/SilA